MSSEELVVQFMQVLKNEEDNLRKNHTIIGAQLQYNLNLQETLKKLTVDYDDQKAKTAQPKKRKSK